MPCPRIDRRCTQTPGCLVALTLFLLAIFPPLSVQAQDPGILGNTFYSTLITTHDESRPQIVIFYDYEDNFVSQGAPVVEVIGKAYDMSSFQITDGPDWIYTPHLYDIKGTPPPAFVPSDKEQMIVSLLADRFRLAVQPETREIGGMIMTLDGGRQPFEYVSDEDTRRFRFLLMPQPSRKRTIQVTFSFSHLARILSGELNQSVIDHTGLSGTYRVELTDYAPAIPQIQFSELLDQFGLVLSPGKIAADVLAVTHIERPVLDD